MNSPAQPNDNSKNEKTQMNDQVSGSPNQGSADKQESVEDKIRHGDLPYQEKQREDTTSSAGEENEKQGDQKSDDYGFLGKEDNSQSEQEAKPVDKTAQPDAQKTEQVKPPEPQAEESQQSAIEDNKEQQPAAPQQQKGSSPQQAGLPDLSGNNMGGSPPPGQMPPPPANDQEPEGNGQEEQDKKVTKKSKKKVSPKVIAGVLGLLLLVGGGVVAVTQFTDFSGDIRQRAYIPGYPGGTTEPTETVTPTLTRAPTPNPTSTPKPTTAPTGESCSYYGGVCRGVDDPDYANCESRDDTTDCSAPNITCYICEGTPTSTPAPNPCNPTRDAYCYDNFGGECVPDDSREEGWRCTGTSDPCNPTRDAYCNDQLGGDGGVCVPTNNNEKGWRCKDTGEICGDGSCRTGETIENCPQDCKSCSEDYGGVCRGVDDPDYANCESRDDATDCSTPDRTCYICEGEPAPTLTSTPAPKVGGACMTTKIYTFQDNGWVETAVSDLPDNVEIGDKIRLAVKGDSAGVAKGRFKINNSSWIESTDKNSKNEYYIEYTLASGGQYTIAGEVLYGQ